MTDEYEARIVTLADILDAVNALRQPGMAYNPKDAEISRLRHENAHLRGTVAEISDISTEHAQNAQTLRAENAKLREEAVLDEHRHAQELAAANSRTEFWRKRACGEE